MLFLVTTISFILEKFTGVFVTFLNNCFWWWWWWSFLLLLGCSNLLPYSEISLHSKSLHVWGSPVRGVSTGRWMAFHLLIMLFLFFVVFYSKVSPKSFGMSSSSKIPRRVNTLCNLPAAKNLFCFTLFNFTTVGFGR